MTNTNLPSVISENAGKLLDAYRASRLNPTQRKLRRYEVTDNEGFLTAFGLRMYMDRLWQKDTAAQKDIADSLDKIAKEDKKDTK